MTNSQERAVFVAPSLNSALKVIETMSKYLFWAVRALLKAGEGWKGPIDSQVARIFFEASATLRYQIHLLKLPNHFLSQPTSCAL